MQARMVSVGWLMLLATKHCRQHLPWLECCACILTTSMQTFSLHFFAEHLKNLAFWFST